MKSLMKGSDTTKIGEILKRVDASNGIVRNGEMKGCTLHCTVMDNRVGRIQGNAEARKKARFVSIADYTGFMNLGIADNETGISKYDVGKSQCTPETRPFFSAQITGNIAWIPTRNDMDTPTFFLNEGRFKKVEAVEWKDENRFIFPTSVVCLQWSKVRKTKSSPEWPDIAQTAWRERLMSAVRTLRDVVLSLEDPVGYCAVEINLDETNETAQALMERNHIREGVFVFSKGHIEVKGHTRNMNAILALESSRSRLT